MQSCDKHYSIRVQYMLLLHRSVEIMEVHATDNNYYNFWSLSLQGGLEWIRKVVAEYKIKVVLMKFPVTD